MKQKVETTKLSAEKVRDIRRFTRKQYGAKEKIRIVLNGLRARSRSRPCAAGKASPRACLTIGRRRSSKPARSGWRMIWVLWPTSNSRVRKLTAQSHSGNFPHGRILCVAEHLHSGTLMPSGASTKSLEDDHPHRWAAIVRHDRSFGYDSAMNGSVFLSLGRAVTGFHLRAPRRRHHGQPAGPQG